MKDQPPDTDHSEVINEALAPELLLFATVHM
jgi:hypothetical protein